MMPFENELVKTSCRPWWFSAVVCVGSSVSLLCYGDFGGPWLVYLGPYSVATGVQSLIFDVRDLVNKTQTKCGDKHKVSTYNAVVKGRDWFDSEIADHRFVWT